LKNRWCVQIGAGSFFWAVTDELAESREFSPKEISSLTLSPETMIHFGYKYIPSRWELYDASTRELLVNCKLLMIISIRSSLIMLDVVCDNIIPTINLTETLRSGYAKHLIPLALENDMVRNAILAFSASQIHATGAATIARPQMYRSAAIKGLRDASTQVRTDNDSALMTLATIFGLLLDDMINENKDFPTLVRLADSWIKLNPTSENQRHEGHRKFLLDQIQMFVAFQIFSQETNNNEFSKIG
jgi:hypothetical protein